MAISTSFSRLAEYRKRHGFLGTIRRASLAARRALFSGRMMLFYCDLSPLGSPTTDLPGFLKVEGHTNPAEFEAQDLQQITSFWNPELAQRKIKERFDLGATLWSIRDEGKLAGYGWTLAARTIEPHYFPLEPGDVHLFDFHVFPPYRGRGLNPALVNCILRSLAMQGHRRALIEAAEWNHAQLASLRRTPFRRLGWARKFTILGRTIVCWNPDQLVAERESKATLGTTVDR